jgi:hypothetical protein
MRLASPPIPQGMIRLKSRLWYSAPPFLSDDATDASGAAPLYASVGRTAASNHFENRATTIRGIGRTILKATPNVATALGPAWTLMQEDLAADG